jgi:hypothetical protein
MNANQMNEDLADINRRNQELFNREILANVQFHQLINNASIDLMNVLNNRPHNGKEILIRADQTLNQAYNLIHNNEELYDLFSATTLTGEHINEFVYEDDYDELFEHRPMDQANPFLINPFGIGNANFIGLDRLNDGPAVWAQLPQFVQQGQWWANQQAQFVPPPPPEVLPIPSSVDFRNLIREEYYTQVPRFPTNEGCAICQNGNPDEEYIDPAERVRVGDLIVVHNFCLSNYYHLNCIVMAYNSSYRNGVLVHRHNLTCPVCRNA